MFFWPEYLGTIVKVFAPSSPCNHVIQKLPSYLSNAFHVWERESFSNLKWTADSDQLTGVPAPHQRQMVFLDVLACSSKDGWLISEVPTVGNDHHSIHPALPQVLEWTLLEVLLSWNPVMKGLVWVVQEDVIWIKLSLRGSPAEGQSVSGVLCDLQICNCCWNWKEE